MNFTWLLWKLATQTTETQAFHLNVTQQNSVELMDLISKHYQLAVSANVLLIIIKTSISEKYGLGIISGNTSSIMINIINQNKTQWNSCIDLKYTYANVASGK